MDTPTNTTTTSTVASPPPAPPPEVDQSTVVGMVMQQPVTAMEDQEKLMRVMVAVDESDQGFYALRWALDHLSFASPSLVTPTPPGEANQKVGMWMTIVHVQEPFQQYIFPAGPGATAFYATSAVAESVKKGQQENSAIILSRALQMCGEKNVKAETLILNGDPKEMICEATEQMHVDLLVVGSRGLGKIKRAFLGSVSDYCAHHANCPILIVRPPKEANK